MYLIKLSGTSFMLSVQRTITNGRSITADVIDDPLVNYYHHVCIYGILNIVGHRKYVHWSPISKKYTQYNDEKKRDKKVHKKLHRKLRVENTRNVPPKIASHLYYVTTNWKISVHLEKNYAASYKSFIKCKLYVITSTWLSVMITYICITRGDEVTRLTRRVPLVQQELLTLPEYLSSPRFYWGSCYSIFSFMCMFSRSLFVLLYLFFWPLCCLLFFDIRILITSLWYLQTLLTSICIGAT